MEYSDSTPEHPLCLQLEILANLLYLAQYHLAKEREYVEWAERVVQELQQPALNHNSIRDSMPPENDRRKSLSGRARGLWRLGPLW